MFEKKPRSVGVHDGLFHADEVTACALLVLYGQADADKVIRTRDEARLAECDFVCDVGGVYNPAQRRFDHHQATYCGEMSSAGMVLDYLKKSGVLPVEEAQFLYQSLIKGVDDHDNGRSPQIPGIVLFSHVVANFAPAVYGAPADEMGRAFHQALEFTVGHVKRLMERHRYARKCRVIVGEAMRLYKQCLLFNEAVPWAENFFALGGKGHSALFVVMPSGAHWKLRGIPPDDEHRMEVRLPLPQAWAGLIGEELRETAKLQGAVFCHKGRFTSVWETKEDALRALKEVLRINGIRQEDNF